MRLLVGVSVLAIAGYGAPAVAGDKVLVAPAPGWILPAPELQVGDLVKSGTMVPRFDEQARIEGDQTTTYIDSAVYIASAEALNKQGTFNLSWSPQHGDLTVHKIEILRGDERIDLLKADPSFTVLRREAGLEKLTVDGDATESRLIDALRVAIDLARERNDRRRRIVLFSDGIDTSAGKEAFSDVARKARESGVVIDAIGFTQFEAGRLRSVIDLSKTTAGTASGA